MRHDAPDLDLLVPRPRRARTPAGAWTPSARPVVAAPASLGVGAAASWVLDELGRLGLSPRRSTADDPAGADVRPRLDPAAGDGSPEGYRLRVGADGVELAAPSPAGLARAFATLAQWLGLHAAGGSHGRAPSIHGLDVVDRPVFRHRGVLLDVSRNRVPRLDVLEAWIDQLARLKVGQVQLYTEHTFAYAGHETVWRGWSPLTPDDVRRLDAFCRQRAVELVPNQNSFGHLHRWLVHEPYRRLAECPDGVVHPFSPEPEPFSLCPGDPGALELLRDLYGQLLPCFESRLFNVGLDETLDLGRCRSEAECAARGKTRVYLDFLERVHALVREHGRRLMFWGDVLLEHPEHLADVPDDVVALDWGYEPDHPFADDCARLAASGRDFYVCPGTGSWNTFAGRLPDALANLASAAAEGRRHGALGYLVTDWGDHGHLQPPPASWPALVAAAECAWNAGRGAGPEALPLAELLDRHVLRDRAGVAGRVLVELGEVHRRTGARALNGSPLFFALCFAERPAAERRGAGMTPATLDATLDAIDRAVAPLADARMDRADASLVVGECRWMADALRLGARLARARLEHGEDRPLADLPSAVRRRLDAGFAHLVGELRPLWLARSRPGGLDPSVARLESVRRLLGVER